MLELVKEKLLELRIAIDPSVVMEIVRHLEAGGSQYALYSNPSRQRPVSNNTVLKIKKLLDEGKLDFLVNPEETAKLVMDKMVAESHREQNEFTTELFFNKATGGYQLRQPDGTVESWDIPASVKELLVDLDAGKYVETVGTIRGTSGPSYFLLEIVNKAERLIGDKSQWSVGNLEKIGLTEDAALEILAEYDELEAARSSSEFTAEIHSKLEPRTYLRKFRGFERYLSILHLVILMKRYPKFLLKYAKPASYLYARGLIADDVAIYTSGEDILRYAIWKGEKHREAYNKSLRRYRRTPKARARLEAEIDALLKGNDDE